MTTTTLLAALLTLLPLGAQGLPDAPLSQAGAQEPGVLAITNAHLHTVSSEPIEGGTLLVEDGRIVALGALAIMQAMRLKEEFDLNLYMYHGGATGSVVDEHLLPGQVYA